MMTLEEVVAPYSHIRLATREDNEGILNFYKDIHMETGDEALSFDRGNDFFKFYERKGNHFWTFLFLNEDLSICGVGTIVRHLRYIDGDYRPVAYFCDLRVSPQGGRRAKVQWRKCFADVISALPKLSDDLRCEMAYTAILSDNEKAIASLTKGGRGYNYRYINNYHVYSVVIPAVFNPTFYDVREIPFSDFKKFYIQEAHDLDLMEEIDDTEGNAYYGVFDGGKLLSIFMISNRDLGRSYKLYNLKFAKKFLTNIVEMMGRPKVDNGILKTLEIQYLCFQSQMSNDTKKDIISAVIKYLKDSKILNQYHICNLYTGQDAIHFSPLIDGVVVENTGHMFEIHSDENQGLWPMRSFRFEGSLL
ncbi:hypothetical protein [Halobacteriovorax sp. RZ-2]|uniref:hypothetical protein n=1 Tax=unclassified Halobacteriovorax TaxID=2639665 RepID=UPI00372293B5